MREVEKLKVSYHNGEIEIMGNRAGLKSLGEICFALSKLNDMQAKTAANYYHFDEDMNNTDPNSVPMLITLNFRALSM